MTFNKFPGLMLLVLSCFGCTSLPTQEMSDARQALQAARDAGADTHAPDQLNLAERLLDQATDSLDEGQYSQARELAIGAKQEAVKSMTAP